MLFLLGLSVLVVVGCQSLVRRMMFYPTHDAHETTLSEWIEDGKRIGYAREVSEPENVWLMLHGNGGQASHRVYALDAFSDRDAVFILEYPGYGQRGGSPSRRAFDAAAREGYAALRARFPGKRVCVVGESLGSGPAAMLSRETPPPDKIAFVVPYDSIKAVARHHMRFLPTGLMVAGYWDNVEAMKGYDGPVDVFGAERDEVIPVSHARRLAESIPQARFHLVPGGHGWANGRDVSFRCD